MELVPATVIGAVAAPEAAHAERPAHLQHHASLCGAGWLAPQIQTDGARKRTGGRMAAGSRARKRPGSNLQPPPAAAEAAIGREGEREWNRRTHT